MKSRRKFLKTTLKSSATTIWGMPVVFGENLPLWIDPIGLTLPDPSLPTGKDPQMLVLTDKPWNIETPAHLLDDAVTPKERMFVRNNGLVPDKLDASTWALTIDGESVTAPQTFTLKDLKSRFKHYTYKITLECAGNGRSEYTPPTPGNQWSVGAVSCAAWTGVRLRDVLHAVGIKDNAVYIGYYGKDLHLSGDPSKSPISRGVPIAKAMEDETLLAFQMNSEDIPLLHGFPLRLIVGGYPASVSGKWLYRISVRNKVHDGEKMLNGDYRMPKNNIAPGEKVPDSETSIIGSMPVKSIITYPKTGALLTKTREIEVRGHAWAGEDEVTSVYISIDFGATWQPCELKAAANRYAWQHWRHKLLFEQKGYYEVWVRATDNRGKSQPMVSPGWNPKGYLNNACHRIAVKVNT